MHVAANGEGPQNDVMDKAQQDRVKKPKEYRQRGAERDERIYLSLKSKQINKNAIARRVYGTRVCGIQIKINMQNLRCKFCLLLLRLPHLKRHKFNFRSDKKTGQRERAGERKKAIELCIRRQ